MSRDAAMAERDAAVAKLDAIRTDLLRSDGYLGWNTSGVKRLLAILDGPQP
jgi:hypothetical protein